MKYIKILILLFFAIDLHSQIDSSFIINKYSDVARKIYHAATKDSSSWERLAYMCDTYGPRLSGSENLEKALKWIHEEMQRDGFVNVKSEKVMVPKWVRGNEYCELVYPRTAKIPMLGLGGSVATPKEGITAPVIVVRDFKELDARAAEVKGKIVVYNQEYINYGQSVEYRWAGASRAAKHGAVASLCRAVTPLNDRHPHTGSMGYEDSILKIPHASISPEDVLLLERLQKRGQNPVIKLYMESSFHPDSESSNVMGELTGSEFPDEILAIGGHIDSWDVGTGAHDDGGGCISTWNAVKLLKDLGLKPRRTIRAVMWVNEENGLRGGQAYKEAHKDEKHVLMFEYDSGTFPPSQIGFSGNDSLRRYLKWAEPLLNIIDSIKVTNNAWGVDIGPMIKLGIPAMSLNTDDKGKYFWYHHSEKDTPDHVDPLDLNKCVAAIALAVYIYADLPVDLPSQPIGVNNQTK